MKNAGTKFILLLFLSILVIPLVNAVLHIKSFEQKDENRVFTPMPEANIRTLDKYPREFENYFNDNFSFRSPLLDLIHQVKYHVFNVSPNPNQNVIGKNGWCFLTGKEKEVYEGNLDLTPTQLDTLDLIWKKRIAYFNERGIKCYWLIAPTKHRIYSEELPNSIAINHGKSRVELLKEHMSASFPGLIIDPTPALLAEKKNRKLYFKLDNHWNVNAGQIASAELMKAIAKNFPSVAPVKYGDYTWKDTITSHGYDKNVLGIASLSEKEQVFKYHKELAPAAPNFGFPVTEGFPYPWEYEFHYVRNPSDTTLPRLLVMRDSFGNQMMPFLKEGFNESVFIFDAWKYGMDQNIIDNYKPKIVVFITLETHLENVIQYNNFW
ncbi:MAG: hypothetical protein V4616_01915 [Bacteroidota bacterium]